MGLDATQATADVFASSPLVAKPWVPILMGLTIPFFVTIARALRAQPTTGPFFIFGLVATFLALYLAPTRVRVGTDGILTSWLGRRLPRPCDKLQELPPLALIRPRPRPLQCP